MKRLAAGGRKALAPFQFAPITTPIAASSSSAWMIAYLFFLFLYLLSVL
jgi:hypothetical protein